MENMISTYVGDLKTRIHHVLSNTQITTDAPPDNQGKGEFISPTDMVASALASCMLTVMGILAERNGFSIEGAEARIVKVMADQPRRISEIIIDLTFPPFSYSDKEKKLLHQAVRICPVAQSLHADLKQTITLHFQ